MKTPSHAIVLFAGVMLFLINASCQFASSLLGSGAAPTPPILSATSQPYPAPESAQPVAPSTLPPSEASPQEISEPPGAGLAEQSCAKDVCTYEGFFTLQRPIGETGRRTIDPTFRFGVYSRNTREAHYGVDLLNSSGTAVLAAADGAVVVAGNDESIPQGHRRGYYGNLVILKHDLPGISEPVFTLYGHLSDVSVKVDDEVNAGQQIGLVGMSGAVPGSTLHFEVRIGENNFQQAHNPELWLVNLPDEAGQPTGALAGRIVDAEGNFLPVESIVLELLSGPGMPAIDQFYLQTYAEKRLMGLNPWGENFAAGDLPAGEYQISFLLNGMQQQIVTVQPGKLTVVKFVIP